MITSSVKPAASPVANQKPYPRIKKWMYDGDGPRLTDDFVRGEKELIVLFTNTGEGVALSVKGDVGHKAGEFFTGWSTSTTNWQDFDGQITLSNE